MEGVEWLVVPIAAGVLLWLIPTQGPKVANFIGRFRGEIRKGQRQVEKEMKDEEQ